MIAGASADSSRTNWCAASICLRRSEFVAVSGEAWNDATMTSVSAWVSRRRIAMSRSCAGARTRSCSDFCSEWMLKSSTSNRSSRL